MKTEKRKMRGKRILTAICVFLLTVFITIPVYAARLRTPSVSVKVMKEVEVSWKRVAGAKKYEIYRATSERGRYKKVKTTSALKWVDSGEYGTRWYKVRAVKGSSKSSFSKSKGIYRAAGMIVAALGRTNIVAGPYTAVKVRVKNPAKNRIYFLGSPASGKTVNTYRYVIAKRSNKKVVLEGRCALSDAAGGTNVLYNSIPGRQTRDFYMTLMYADKVNKYPYWTAASYAKLVNDKKNYITAVYPYFTTSSVNRSNPARTKLKYTFGMSTLGYNDTWIVKK